MTEQNNSKRTVCSKKSDAKIEITITATNLTRIKYPLSIFNYHLYVANVANFNKIHCTVFEQQLFKKWNSQTEVSNMEKSPQQFVHNTISSVCAQNGRHQHRHLHVSCADRTFSAAAELPVCRRCIASICRRSRSSAEQDQSLSGNSSNNFLAL